MNKTLKTILGVLLSVVAIFVVFNFFVTSSIRYFGGSEEAIKVVEYIAVYVPIFIVIVTIIGFAAKIISGSGNDQEKNKK